MLGGPWYTSDGLGAFGGSGGSSGRTSAEELKWTFFFPSGLPSRPGDFIALGRGGEDDGVIFPSISSETVVFLVFGGGGPDIECVLLLLPPR